MMLPGGFEALEPFAERWSGAIAADRAALRAAYPQADRDAFYAASAPLLEAGLAYLDAIPLAAHAAADTRLMHLLLTFAHVSLAVEVQASDEDRHTPMRATMRITRATADG